jgi:hypothetical protein
MLEELTAKNNSESVDKQLTVLYRRIPTVTVKTQRGPNMTTSKQANEKLTIEVSGDGAGAFIWNSLISEEAIIAAAPKRVIQVNHGAKLHAFIGKDALPLADELIKRTLRNGGSITENGTTSYLEFRPVKDPSNHVEEHGHADIRAYIWDKAGNKIKWEKVLVEYPAHGYPAADRVETSQGFVWRVW